MYGILGVSHVVRHTWGALTQGVNHMEGVVDQRVCYDDYNVS